MEETNSLCLVSKRAIVARVCVLKMIENRRIKCFTFIVFLIVCVEVFLNIGPSTEVFMQTGQLSKALSCPRTSFVKRRSTTHRKNWDIVALASFPGSGNTWVREMIQQGLGVWTGAVYKDPGLLHNGFIAEGQKDSSVIVVSTENRHGALRVLIVPQNKLL